ncbi:MAG: SOS response-associated peptidase family protein, partial [Sediminibacterium sp.]|nr:SOS response-associated peptidase family protein [Sediminibacterium sp.]
MCFYVKISKTATELENRFGKKMLNPTMYNPTKKQPGFGFPKTPVITNKNKDAINALKWGLIPAWSKNTDIEKYTLNAKIETLHEKPSFKNIMQNTCLIIV